MKKIMILIITAAVLTGCGATGLDQLSACGECFKGVQELADAQGLIPLLDKTAVPAASLPVSIPLMP